MAHDTRKTPQEILNESYDWLLSLIGTMQWGYDASSNGARRISVDSNGNQLTQIVNSDGDSADIKLNEHSNNEELLVNLEGHVCAQNSFSGAIDADASFIGSWQDTLDYNSIIIGIKMDQNSATNGLDIQWSYDGTDAHICDHDYFSIYANNGKVFTFCPARRYFRVVYTNGSVSVVSCSIQSILKRGGIKGSSHRIQDSIVAEDDAELVKSVITGENPAGTFVNFQSTTAGNFKVALEEFESETFDTNPLPVKLNVDSALDIAQAINVVYSTYGDTVSVNSKQKSLNKFGAKSGIGNSNWETVMSFQSTETRLTYPSTNLIDSIISSSSADTSKTYVYEGHSVDVNGNLTFVVDEVTTDASDGQTRVALPTPVRNLTRAYLKNSGTFNSPQTVHAGIISFYDDTDGDNSSGVPTTASAVSLRLLAGETQSEKAATSTSQIDYWFISALSVAIKDASPTANFVTFRMVVRDVKNGGVWRPLGRDYVAYADTSQPGRIPQLPFRIVPKNHDWEVWAKTDTGTADVFAEAEGYLATIV